MNDQPIQTDKKQGPVDQELIDKVNPTPDWLDKLQNESWQAEILISGGAFVGLISIFDSWGDFIDSLLYSSNIHGMFILFFGITILFCCVFLTTGFLVHLILRGYWIGLIGLNYIFPAGINKDKLSFKGSFSKLFRNPSNVPIIVRLDKICSGIFAFTFIWLFSLLGFFIFVCLVSYIVYALILLDSKLVSRLSLVILIPLILGGLITLIDYLTFGWLKRIKWLSRIYYPVHYFVSLVTLSITYRRLYYTLTSNIKLRYLFLFLVVLQILVIAVLFVLPNGTTKFVKSFMPKNSGIESLDNSNFLSIKDEIVTSSTLEVSLIHFVRLEKQMFEIWQLNNKANLKVGDFSQLGIEDQLKLIDSTYQIFIDKRLVTGLKWSPRKTKESKNAFSVGRNILRTRIDVGYLANGQHELTVKIKATEFLPGFTEIEDLGYAAKIYFYVERFNENSVVKEIEKVSH